MQREQARVQRAWWRELPLGPRRGPQQASSPGPEPQVLPLEPQVLPPEPSVPLPEPSRRGPPLGLEPLRVQAQAASTAWHSISCSQRGS